MSFTNTETAEPFDYGTTAELFSPRSSRGRRQPLDYKRFVSAAEAIRFAIEDLAPQFLTGTYLEADETRYECAGIRRLYASSHYPLPRRDVDPLV
jgi:hypothetical protein